MNRLNPAFFLNREKKEKDPDVSPLIDMVFILLIFFIVTTVFVDEVGMEVLVPGPPPIDAPAVDTESIVLHIESNGTLRYGEEKLILADIPGVIRSKPANTPILLEVEDEALAGWMVQVVDAARIGGAKLVSVRKYR